MHLYDAHVSDNDCQNQRHNSSSAGFYQGYNQSAEYPRIVMNWLCIGDKKNLTRLMNQIEPIHTRVDSVELIISVRLVVHIMCKEGCNTWVLAKSRKTSVE